MAKEVPPRGDHGPYRAAATAGDTAHQLHAAFRFKGPGHQIAAGEGDGRGETVQVQPPSRQGVLLIESPVQVHVRPVGGGGFRAAEGVLYGKLRVAQHSADHIDRCGGCAARVLA